MALELDHHVALARRGVEEFWVERSRGLPEDEERSQGGERDGVLSGRNMNGFLAMIENLVRGNGLPNATIYTKGRPTLTLPGYYRPTKLWDVLVFDGSSLVAAIEFKSHVGPSFGNNFNNRAEEAIGTACDLLTAIRENALGEQPRPFMGWLILVEDCPKSRRPPRRETSPHFPIHVDFRGASYLQRYDVLCRRLMSEGLYSQTALLVSPRTAIRGGEFGEMSAMTGLHAFAAQLAGHVASWAARKPGPR